MLDCWNEPIIARNIVYSMNDEVKIWVPYDSGLGGDLEQVGI